MTSSVKFYLITWIAHNCALEQIIHTVLIVLIFQSLSAKVQMLLRRKQSEYCKLESHKSVGNGMWTPGHLRKGYFLDPPMICVHLSAATWGRERE